MSREDVKDVVGYYPTYVLCPGAASQTAAISAGNSSPPKARSKNSRRGAATVTSTHQMRQALGRGMNRAAFAHSINRIQYIHVPQFHGGIKVYIFPIHK